MFVKSPSRPPLTSDHRMKALRSPDKDLMPMGELSLTLM
jgi:hypothetical protein